MLRQDLRARYDRLAVVRHFRPAGVKASRRRPQARPNRRFERLEDRSVLSATFGSAVDLDWAFSIGSAEPRDESWDTATDAAGNAYIAGWFSGSMDFDPEPPVEGDANEYVLTSAGGYDTFVAKYTPQGTLAWAMQMGSSGADAYDYAYSLAVDGFGNVLVTGKFGGQAQFGDITLTSAGAADAYVAKLDGVNGDVLWANQLGGAGSAEYGRSIAVDMNTAGETAGDVYVVGNFTNPDFFVAKYEPDGTQAWVKQSASTNASDTLSARGVAVDSSTGSVITIGSFNGYGNVNFDPNATVAPKKGKGTRQEFAFTQKLDTNGIFEWTHTLAGAFGADIAVDSSGSAYITGEFSGKNIDFDWGGGQSLLTSAGGWDAYVAKIYGDGSFAWAKRLGGKNHDGGRAIALDSENGLYVAGYFFETADLDPGAATYNVSSAGVNDVFVVKLDANANFVWGGSMGGASHDNTYGIAVDSYGDVFISGMFSGTADFDPSLNEYNLTSRGGNDTFLVKLAQPSASMAFSASTFSNTTYSSGPDGTSPAKTEVVLLTKRQDKPTAASIDAVFSDTFQRPPARPAFESSAFEIESWSGAVADDERHATLDEVLEAAFAGFD